MADEANEKKASGATTPGNTKRPRAPRTVTAKKEAAAAKPTTDQRLALDDEIDREMRELELETKRITLKLARRNVDDFDRKESERVRKAEAAQVALRAESYGKRMTAAACQHKLGGFGLEDIYNGDDRPSIAIADMPIVGMRKVFCTRCPKEWSSPDPRLKKSDPEKYMEQAAEWKEGLQLIKLSRAKAMGGPTFAFETMQGEPVHPVLV